MDIGSAVPSQVIQSAPPTLGYAASVPPGPSAAPAPAPLIPYAGGIMSMQGNASIEAHRRAAVTANARPYIQNLANYVRAQWQAALQAKRQTIEPRMLQSVRQRRGEYDPDIAAEIAKEGTSDIYMMLTSNKCRAASSWIRDVMLGTKDEKPWTVDPTPLPDLPPMIMQSVMALSQQEAAAYQQATGQQLGPTDVARIQQYVKDRVIENAKKRADEACERMETKMEDQLVEGGFQRALSEFIEDIVTFPAAILKGPSVRNKPRMKWEPDPAQQGNFTLQVTDELVLEWDRVDPFMAYPAPHATNIDDGYFIERHKLTREAVREMRGVEGYSDDAIDAVLDQYGRGGLNEWLYIDTQKALVEGKSVAAVAMNPDGLIDALQYWGSVQGKLLIEWGIDRATLTDPLKDYPCEVWLIGEWVIKATLNPDPLRRKPYFKASYEEVPGVFWGNSVADLCRDSQDQCNVAARAIANNMGIASGPQVTYNVDRIPAGEDLTQLYPWKIHQHTSDPYGSVAPAVGFFAPPLVAGELQQVYAFFSNLADEHTGVPRYMVGDLSGSSGMRTASQTSMMMGNAGKAIKQVIANIDVNVLQPLIERLYFYNMRFADDLDLKGDVNIVARGANTLIVKEAAQQRRNEFMQLALTNPMVGQIVGEEAIAALLREGAKTLEMDTDSIVPRPEVIRARVYQQRMAAQQQAAQAAQVANAPSEEIEVQRGPDGKILGMVVKQAQQHLPTLVVPPFPVPASAAGGGAPGPRTMSPPNQNLRTGAPVTDLHSPMRRA